MAMAVSNQQSRDAALLRATTELFSLASRHDPDEIRRFEELATHFLGKVSAGDRAFVAERLSKTKDAPASVLRMLGKDLIEIASPILRRSETVSEIDLLSILSSTGPAHHRQIAQRPELPAPVVGALRLVGDAETIELLRHYPESPIAARQDVAPTAPAMAVPAVPAAPPAPAPRLAPVAAEPTLPPAAVRTPEAREVFAAARAMTAALSLEMASFSALRPIPKREAVVEPAVATTIVAPESDTAEPAVDLDGTVDEPPSLVEASTEIDRPAAEAAEPAPAEAEPVEPAPADTNSVRLAEFLSLDARGRTEALARLCGRVGPADPGLTILDADKAFRIALSSARVSQFARQRQRDALLRTLATGLKLGADDVAAIADDPSGEALVVLLRAIGLSDAETHQILLFANPVISSAVDAFFRLARLTGEVGREAAGRIVGGWREESGQPRARAHQPMFADLPLRSTLRAETLRRPEEPAAERRTAG
ncbi:DUF2336 domain-containing protein [Kaistia algarum]|uniref:DUF2336 domain-containing protein n=1 Tax=Kaistia algarum TaxID=2083279 RepID=UPI001401ED27|nr:DUF2336 domain-containing protein [Kaistia algarum]MCX5512155.1 DUF2336 domain-containing protein [Kaistia algarum]